MSNPVPLRVLGFWTTASLVVGSMIGSGIFKKPALLAQQLGSPTIMLMVWIAAGLITLCGALATAELAAAIPKSGGPYAYFHKIFGPFVAFLYGWSCLLVIQSGSIASIAYVFSEYLGRLVTLPRLDEAIEKSFSLHIVGVGTIYPLADLGVKAVTILLIGLLTWVNIRGARFGGGIQLVMTQLKVLAIMALVVAGLSLGDQLATNFSGAQLPATVDLGWWATAAASMAGAFWAYDGWLNSTFIAGEVKDPERTFPKALGFGTLLVLIVYTLTNLSVLSALPLQEIAASKLVAATAMEKLIGPMGAILISIAIMISAFGATNGSTMASPRLYYAMAQDGLLPKSLGQLHGPLRTPKKALLLQWLWASVLTISGTFDQLTDMLIFVVWFFYGTAVLSVFVARLKFPEMPRPYRAWGFPILPLAFVSFAGFFLCSTLWRDFQAYSSGESALMPSVMGMTLVLGTSPFYWWMKRKGT